MRAAVTMGELQRDGLIALIYNDSHYKFILRIYKELNINVELWGRPYLCADRHLKSRKDKDPALFVSPFRWVQDKDGKMVRDDDNFSATDWAEEFRGQYKTPMQLIEILQDTAKLLKEGIAPNRSKSYWQDVLEQCKGWEVDTDNEYAGEAR